MLHIGVLCLAFQHPFVSKVTSNRALRELVAEAKAEVMEEIEDSRDEAEDDDSSESASVSAALPAPRQALHRVGLQRGEKPPAWLPKAASWLLPPDTHGRRLLLCWGPSGGWESSFLAREQPCFGGCQGHRETMALAGSPAAHSQEGCAQSSCCGQGWVTREGWRAWVFTELPFSSTPSARQCCLHGAWGGR